jgi:hypothetical protein
MQYDENSLTAHCKHSFGAVCGGKVEEDATQIHHLVLLRTRGGGEENR